MSLEERTVAGLHEFLVASVLPTFAIRSRRAVDLGAGSGALAVRLQGLGMEVVAVDVNRDGFKANVPFISLDLNASDFAGRLGAGTFDLVTATEVIEHVESPIGFLRNVRRLLRTGGVAIMTTPNVDNAPARVKFLLTGRLRMMDDRGDPTHISPIFVDLLVRQYLPRAGLSLVGRLLYPSNGYRASRSQYALLLRLLGRLLPGPDLLGDNHVFVFRPGGEADG